MPLSTRVKFNTGRDACDACIDHVARIEQANARSLAAQCEAENAVNATTATAAIAGAAPFTTGRRRFINNDRNDRNFIRPTTRPLVRPLPSTASLVDHTPLERRNRNNAALAGLTDAQWQAYVNKERAHLRDVNVNAKHKYGPLHAHAPPTQLLSAGLGRADALEKLSVHGQPRKKTIMTPQQLRDDTQLALNGSIDTDAASVLAQNAIYEAKWDRDQVLRHQYDAAAPPLSAERDAAARTIQSQTTPSLAAARALAYGPVTRSRYPWREAQRQVADFTETMAEPPHRDAAADRVIMHHQHQYHLDPAALTMTAPEITSAQDWSTKALEAAANRDARNMEDKLIEQHKQVNAADRAPQGGIGNAAYRTAKTYLEGPAAIRALEHELAHSHPIQRREAIFKATSMPNSIDIALPKPPMHTAAPSAVPARRYESTARAMGRDLERSGLMQLGLAEKAPRASRYESTAMAMGHDVEKSSTHFGKNDAVRATAPSPFNRSHRRSWGAAEAGPLPLPEHVDPAMYVTENRASFRVPFQW